MEQTLTPVWNTVWNVKRVPVHALLKVEVKDRDEGSPMDDYIGSFETTLSHGPKEVDIVGPILKTVKGSFWLNVSWCVNSVLYPATLQCFIDHYPTI